MIDRFRAYLDKTFNYLPYTVEADDLREEMLSGLMERAQDLKAEGLGEDEIFSRCIESLGDYTEAIKALKRKPLAVLKDTKFHKAMIATLCFVLTSVVIYLILGVTMSLWGKGALIIFPTMAVIIYFALMASLLIRNIKFHRHFTSGVIIASILVIFDTALFFILWECGVAPKYGWLVFTYIPFLITISHFIARGLLRKKKLYFISYIPLIFSIVTPVYLTSSMLTGLWHPLWILFVVAVLITLIGLLSILFKKVEQKNRWR